MRTSLLVAPWDLEALGLSLYSQLVNPALTAMPFHARKTSL